MKTKGGGVKQSLYFPEEMLQEIQREAIRQDRSMSWVIQQAWRLGRDKIATFETPEAIILAKEKPKP